MDFDYGVIEYKHRFTLNRSLDDYEVTRIEKCISVSLWRGYKTMAHDKLVNEFQILYRDKNHKTQILKLDLDDWKISLVYKGNMSLVI